MFPYQQKKCLLTCKIKNPLSVAYPNPHRDRWESFGTTTCYQNDSRNDYLYRLLKAVTLRLGGLYRLDTMSALQTPPSGHGTDFNATVYLKIDNGERGHLPPRQNKKGRGIMNYPFNTLQFAERIKIKYIG